MSSSPIIESAQCFQVVVPLRQDWVTSPEFGPHIVAVENRLIFLLRDSDGIEGWGELTMRGSLEAAETALSMVVGKTLDELRATMLALAPAGTLYWQEPMPPSPYTPPVGDLQHRIRRPLQLPIETALWDLLGKRAGVSVSTLWGGRWRDRVATDWWMGRTTPEFAQQCVRRGLEAGFHGIKLKTTLEDPNVERLEAIRDAAPDWKVTVDPNGRFHRLDDALPTVLEMDRVGNMGILEDPFPRFHLQDFAALRSRINARVVVHIDPPETLWQVLTSGAAGGLNIDSHTQGITNWRLQAGAAAAANLPIWHGSGLDLGIYTAAQLHMAASTPNCKLPGDQVGPWLRETHLMTENFTVEAGHVLVPTGPGLGIEIDRAELERVTRAEVAVSAS